MKVLVLDSDLKAAEEAAIAFQGSAFDLVLAASPNDAQFILDQEFFEVLVVHIDDQDHSLVSFGLRMTGRYPHLKLAFLADDPAMITPEALPHSHLGVIQKPLLPSKLALVVDSAHLHARNYSSLNEVRQKMADGGFGSFSLVDVIQMCCISRKTGLLVVQSRGREGDLYVHNGAVVHAEAPGHEGEEAVYEILSWEDAQSSLTENASSPKTTIHVGWEHLLMEGVRRKDEMQEVQDLRSDAGAEQLIGKMVGPFRVDRKIASDYWGTLYEAQQVAVNRPVALKVLNPAFYGNGDRAQQFIGFAGAMARAQNPYIVTVYEAGQANGLIFYAREQVDGASLKERLRRGETLSEDMALRVIMNVGEALHYEKDQGILHLPLMIDQILIPDTGVPKLFNNVTMEGGETSPGEVDEIHRLAAIMRQAIAVGEASPGFQKFIERMEGQGFGDWSSLLREAQDMEMHRRADRVDVSISSGVVAPMEPERPSGRPWKVWVLVPVMVALVAGVGGYAFLKNRHPGAQDVDVMLPVSAGPFAYQNEKSTLPVFYIDKYEVTIDQYRQFLETWKRNKVSIQEHPKQRPGKDHTPAQWNLMLNAIETKSLFNGVRIHENTPVFNVDFFDAWAYARWAGKRLPTEYEWEKAARGTEGWLFPWGNQPDPSRANTGADLSYSASDSTFGRIDGFGIWAPVGALPMDRSPFGVMDMAGNVSEWTDSWDTNPDFSTEQIPVVRGGSWASVDVKLTNRDLRQPSLKRSRQIGFRCVSDRPIPNKAP